jgi:hypothetical protein
LALLASIIPFGTFWADAKLFREKWQMSVAGWGASLLYCIVS